MWINISIFRFITQHNEHILNELRVEQNAPRAYLDSRFILSITRSYTKMVNRVFEIAKTFQKLYETRANSRSL